MLDKNNRDVTLINIQYTLASAFPLYVRLIVKMKTYLSVYCDTFLFVTVTSCLILKSY